MRIGKIFSAFFLLLSISVTCSAQIKNESKKVNNLNKGLFFGYGNSKFRIKESNWKQTTYRDSLSEVKALNAGALNFGFLLGYPLSPITTIRIKFGLDFVDNVIYFYRPNQLEEIKLPETAIIIPTHILISAPFQHIKRYRPHFFLFQRRKTLS